MESIEQSIVKGLLYDEDYTRRVYPYLKAEYFDGGTREIFEIYSDLFDRYNRQPNMEAMLVAVQKKDLVADVFEDVVSALQTAHGSRAEPVQTDWLVDETQSYCSDKALFNAIYKSIAIIEGGEKTLDKHAIPVMLDEALSIDFCPTIGSDYLEDFQRRYEYYTNTESRLRFPLEALNVLTNGGLPPKTLNAFLAGCVHPDTKIRIRRELDGVTSEPMTVAIKDIEVDIEFGVCRVFVDSPDGYVEAVDFVDKGDWVEWVAEFGSQKVRVNENHLFETERGWVMAKHMKASDKVLHDSGVFVDVNVYCTGKMIPIVDIQIDHENHRYYTEGLSSHNTNVGKSALMCFLAGEWLRIGKNVLYITLEMSEESVQERIDANLMDISTDKLKTPGLDKAWFESKIAKLKSKTNGKLIVKEYPTSSAHAGHFRHLLKDLAQKKKFKPDVIFIDYINICASSRYKAGAGANSYTIVKSIAEELRGLAVEFVVPVITATQTNREGMSSQSPDMTSTSECLTLDTEVITNNGKKLIADVQVGDKLLGSDGFVTVSMVHHPKVKKVYKITTKSGKTIKCSADHVFPTHRGRYSINSSLGVGDKLKTLIDM